MAKLDIESVANRSVQIDIRLLNAKVAARAGEVGERSVEANRIWPSPHLKQISRPPITLADRFGDRERNDVQIEAVLLRAGTVKRPTGNPSSGRAGPPNG